MGFALTLVARTWMKLNEPRLLEFRRRLSQQEARRRVRQIEEANGAEFEPEPEEEEAPPLTAVQPPQA